MGGQVIELNMHDARIAVLLVMEGGGVAYLGVSLLLDENIRVTNTVGQTLA